VESAFPTLKRGANEHCAYGAAARTLLIQQSIKPTFIFCGPFGTRPRGCPGRALSKHLTFGLIRGSLRSSFREAEVLDAVGVEDEAGDVAGGVAGEGDFADVADEDVVDGGAQGVGVVLEAD